MTGFFSSAFTLRNLFEFERNANSKLSTNFLIVSPSGLSDRSDSESSNASIVFLTCVSQSSNSNLAS